MKRFLILATVLLAAIGLTACSGTSSGAPGATSSASLAHIGGQPVSTSPSTSPTVVPVSSPPQSKHAPKPTTWTIHQSATAYLALVNVFNAEVDRWNAIYNDSAASLAKISRTCGQQARGLHKLALRLLQGNWPLAVRPYVTKLVNATSDQETEYTNCAGDTSSVGDAESQVSGRTTNKRVSAANRLRLALGLPGVPTK